MNLIPPQIIIKITIPLESQSFNFDCAKDVVFIETLSRAFNYTPAISMYRSWTISLRSWSSIWPKICLDNGASQFWKPGLAFLPSYCQSSRTDKTEPVKVSSFKKGLALCSDYLREPRRWQCVRQARFWLERWHTKTPYLPSQLSTLTSCKLSKTSARTSTGKYVKRYAANCPLLENTWVLGSHMSNFTLNLWSYLMTRNAKSWQLRFKRSEN